MGVTGTRITRTRDPSYQGYPLFRIGLVQAPIVTGLDKFLNVRSCF